MDLRELIQRLATLEQRVEFLEAENASLKEELAKYRTPKNSINSSLPPSKDENRPKKNQSLRRASDRKPGGQAGHQGKTLEMSSFPDEVIDLYPTRCQTCGLSLANLSCTLSEVRQKLDIPPIQSLFTEYRTFSKVCTCGCTNMAVFPEGVNARVSYGPHIESLIGYFHARQYLPFARMQEMFNHVFGTLISEGGLHYLLERFSKKATPIYEQIKLEVASSPVIGSDETGSKVNGDKHWFWTWQTPKHTFIAHSDNRSGNTINQLFANGFPESTIVHDGWKPQINTIAKNHQSCIAHLLRILKYLNERYPESSWGLDFITLLWDALDLKKQMKSEDYLTDFTPRDQLIQRLEKLLEKPPKEEYKEMMTFFRRMNREKQFLFTFLNTEEVPPDNNASERAIRNIKVKQKISGQFKTVNAAKNFAKIRSVIDTAIKNGLNVVNELCLIAKYQIPSVTD